MSFEDDLKELIFDAQAEAERRNQVLIEFRNSWQWAKNNTVKPVLDKTVKVLEAHSKFSAKVELRNGSIYLKMGPKSDPKQPVTNELRFAPNEETREIECMYANPDLVLESFSLDSLDASTVESKVKEFLSAALG
jgi:hypothetical protein